MEADNTQVQALPEGQVDQAQGAATAQHQTELMIPKRRFDEVTQMYRETLAKNSALEKEIEGYKVKDTKISELEQQIADMKSNYELEKTNAKKTSAIDKLIADKTVDPDVVKSLLDMSKISINDKGEVEGVEDQIKQLQASKAYLFKKPQPAIAKSATGATKPEKTLAQKMAEKKVNAMSATSKAKTYFN